MIAMATLDTTAAVPGPSIPWRRTNLASLLGACLALVEIELLKLKRDPTDLMTRSVQPVLWLLIFGNVFSSLHAVPSGNLNYVDFMTPGIMAQGVLFLAIFYGIGVIWERDMGVIHRLLVSPAPRVALVLGKALSAGVRAVAQATLLYLLAWLLGVHLCWRLGAVFGVGLVVVLGAMAFSTFSLVIACSVKSRERFMGIGQLLTMPLFFASNAIYPTTIMPGWLRVVARVNPLTYQVDALRALMIVGGESQFGLTTDIAVLTLTVAILTTICTRLYPNLVR